MQLISDFTSNRGEHMSDEIDELLSEAKAQFELGCIYYDATDELDSLNHAFKWFLKAAEQEHAEAQMTVARMIDQDGCGGGLNDSFKWYERAAKNGNKDAQFHLWGIREHPNNIEEFKKVREK